MEHLGTATASSMYSFFRMVGILRAIVCNNDTHDSHDILLYDRLACVGTGCPCKQTLTFNCICLNQPPIEKYWANFFEWCFVSFY